MKNKVLGSVFILFLVILSGCGDSDEPISPPVTCTSWTYSEWGACSASGQQIRTIVSSSPNSCTGGNPILAQSCTPAPKPAYQVFGLNVGSGTAPGVQISDAQIRERLSIIAPFTKSVRSFSSTFGEENFCKIAHEFGLKCYQGAWIGKDAAANKVQIANLIQAGKLGYLDVAVIGSEVLFRTDQSADVLIGYINEVKAALPDIPVTTGDTYNSLLDNPRVMAACDLLFPNYYPIWEGYSIEDAVPNLAVMHQKMVAASAGKRIVVSETGWSSCGTPVYKAVPNLVNSASFFKSFVSWARANDVDFFYFEAVDESSKAAESENIAHCWGIWYENGVMKPGMMDVFNNLTVPITPTAPTPTPAPTPAPTPSCGSLVGGPGTPTITVTFEPSKGSMTNVYMTGYVDHIIPDEHKIVLYIYVLEYWWIKPTWANPLTWIGCDGSWKVSTVTGGVDQDATKLAIFLIPNSYTPPSDYDEAALKANSKAYKIINR